MLSLNSRCPIHTKVLRCLICSVAKMSVFNQFIVTITETAPQPEIIISFLRVLCYSLEFLRLAAAIDNP